MTELTLATPSILFSAISLIMLAYTNRFIAYAQVIRNIAAEYQQRPTEKIRCQIKNLKARLHMIRLMQITGLLSLFLCVISLFFIYIGIQIVAVWLFAVALLLLIGSLGLSIAEIHISVKALDIHLKGIESSNKCEI